MKARRLQGIVLVTAIFVVVIITMLIVSAVKLSNQSLSNQGKLDQRELALWAATSGLEYAQTRLQDDYTWQGGLGKGSVRVVDQPGVLVVQEDNGNVVGVLTRDNGTVAQFLIRFSPQDGTDDPAYLIQNPYISVNNLRSDSAAPVYMGNGPAWVQTSDTNHDCPPRSATIIVEGRAGSALSTDPTSPDPSDRVFVSRVTEATFSPDGSGLVPGLLYGGADINFNSDDAKGAQVNLSSIDDAKPTLTAGAGMEASSGSGKIASKSGANLSINQSGGHSVVANTGANITELDNAGTLNFPDIEWDTIPHADGSKTSIPAGVYVWRNDGGGHSLYYYDEDYNDGLWTLPPLDPTDRVNNDFSGLPGASGTGMSYDPVLGRINVTEDVLVSSTGVASTLAVVSEDDGNTDKTFNFSPPDGETAVLTNEVGSVVIDATVRGTGGTITSAGKIELTGAGYDLYNEPDAVTGLSLYAKDDIFLQTFEAPAGTAKGTTKGKNGKGNPEVKSGAPGKFFDMKLTGVIYTWGDFTADLGGKAKLEMKGSLVAYGSDPSVGPPVAGQGYITMAAKDLDLVYDSRYLVNLLQSGSGPLKRTMWVVY